MPHEKAAIPPKYHHAAMPPCLLSPAAGASLLRPDLFSLPARCGRWFDFLILRLPHRARRARSMLISGKLYFLAR